MGQSVGILEYRLGVSSGWKHLSVTNKLTYSLFFLKTRFILNYIKGLFIRVFFKKIKTIYSHTMVHYGLKGIIVNIFLVSNVLAHFRKYLYRRLRKKVYRKRRILNWFMFMAKLKFKYEKNFKGNKRKKKK